MTDQRYLREVQYRSPDRLNARARLHTKYGRGDWFDWLASAIGPSPGATIADIGCGDGAFWLNAPATIPNDLRLRLFDISPGMVEAASSRLRELARWNGVSVEVADAAALPLQTGSADTVLAIHMLYHLPDPSVGIGEMARILAPEGTAAVVLNPSGTMAELSALVDAALDRETRVRHEPLTSNAALPLLRSCFGSVQRVRFEDELVVTDAADLLAYLLSLPVAAEDDAADKLAAAVEGAFATGAFRISKAVDLLLCKL